MKTPTKRTQGQPPGEGLLDRLPTLPRISRSSPVPYYYQIAEALRDMVENTKDRAASREVPFPSEAELCAAFQVTRGTVRHALQVLEREGLIYRRKGRGTFVARRRLAFDLTRLYSITDDLRARGWQPGTRLLGLEEITPPLYIQRALKLPKRGRVWELRRLRLADGEPVSLVWSYVPAHLTPNLDQHDLTGSVNHLLEQEYGLKLHTADQVVRTRGAAGEEARLLEIPEGEPVFVITGVAYDQNEVPVEYLDSLWRGDRYDLQVRRFSRD
jgi:GntR family transcriptional regulator